MPARNRVDIPRATAGAAGLLAGLCAIVVCGLVVMAPRPAAAAARVPIVESDVEGGRLFLKYGYSRLFYWKIGDDSGGLSCENGAMYADKKWPGRQYMDEHPGDWCGLLFLVDARTSVVIDKNTKIEMELSDGAVVRSDDILIVGDLVESWVANAAVSSLYLSGDLQDSRYARSPNQKYFGAYGLFVRFPEGSCLSDKTDGIERYFKTKPVRLAIHGCQVARGGE